MNKTVIHLLGYLNDDEWADAYNSADGVSHKKQEVKDFYKKVKEHYNLPVISHRMVKLFGE